MTNSNLSATLNTSNLYKHPWYTQLKLLDNTMTCESPLQPKLKLAVTGQKSTSWCFACRTDLPLTEFNKNRSRRDGVQNECKSCQAAYRRLRKQHVMPADQTCQLCNTKPAQHWDHCHNTLDHRGWLCGTCNQGLGNFQDNPTLLQKAIIYLSTNNGSQI